MKDKPYTKLHEYRQAAKKEDLTCAKCGRVGFMSLDHIIPCAFIDAMGLTHESYDHDWNFQYLCRACNGLKSNRFDFTNPKTLENLKRYVEIAEQVYEIPR